MVTCASSAASFPRSRACEGELCNWKKQSVVHADGDPLTLLRGSSCSLERGLIPSPLRRCSMCTQRMELLICLSVLLVPSPPCAERQCMVSCHVRVPWLFIVMTETWDCKECPACVVWNRGGGACENTVAHFDLWSPKPPAVCYWTWAYCTEKQRSTSSIQTRLLVGLTNSWLIILLWC